MPRHPWICVNKLADMLPTLEAEGIKIDYKLVLAYTATRKIADDWTDVQSINDLYQLGGPGQRRDAAVSKMLARYLKDPSSRARLTLAAWCYDVDDIVDPEL